MTPPIPTATGTPPRRRAHGSGVEDQRSRRGHASARPGDPSRRDHGVTTLQLAIAVAALLAAAIAASLVLAQALGEGV